MDSFLMDRNQYRALGQNPGVPILGIGLGGFSGLFTDQKSDTRRWTEYVAVPPLEGPEGVRYAGYFPTNGATAWTITDKCENPEAAFRLGDFLLSTEATLGAVVGREGIEWKWPDEGSLGINGEPAVWQAIKDFGTHDENVTWAQAGPQLRSAEFRLGESVVSDDVALSTILYEETKNKYEQYKPSDDMVLPPLAISDEDMIEYTELKNTFQEYVHNEASRFITGDTDLEEGWDVYLKELDRIGLDRYLEIVQKAYDLQYK